jgi:Nucleotide-diphospho-sugar transferase
MKTNLSGRSDTAICFLLINQIKELPYVAIKSALTQTSSDIFIGYLDAENLVDIPSDQRIKCVKLSIIDSISSPNSTSYQDFGTEAFYKLVILKWDLLRQVSGLDYKYIIYSDIDVVWLGDAALAIKKSFELFAKAHIFVQSFTRSPNDALLCMGIFAFRNTKVSIDFIGICESDHKIAIQGNETIGDDEIVTAANKKLGFPEYLRELPQSTFAVGNFLDLYSSKPRFPGVHKPIPLIFHCNYVVGLRNKRLMLRLILNRNQRKALKIKFGIDFYILLTLKRVRTSKMVKWVYSHIT